MPTPHTPPPNPYMAQATAWSNVAAAATEVERIRAELADAERALHDTIRKHRGHLSLRNLEALTGVPRSTLASQYPEPRGPGAWGPDE